MPLQIERGVKKAVAQLLADMLRKGESDPAKEASEAEAAQASKVEDLVRLGRIEEAHAQLDIEERQGLWLRRDEVNRAFAECQQVLDRVLSEVSEGSEAALFRAAAEGPEAIKAHRGRLKDELTEACIRALVRLASDA